MVITVRKAILKDAKEIAQVGSQSFKNTFGWQFEHVLEELDTYIDKTYAVEKISSGLNDDNNVFWLAFSDEIPIGFAKLKKRSGYNGDEGFSQLQKIYVLHEYLGTGAGKMLYARLEEEWLSLNSDFIWLLVEINNERAIRFYEKKGYAKNKRTEFIIGSQTFEFELMQKKKASNNI